MIFTALYFTENENDDGVRTVEAASLEDAKAVLKAAILAEGTHGAGYYLSSLIETPASFANRKKVAT